MPAVWKPLYLRLWVLITFIVVFAILIPTLEILLIISNHDKGLTTAQQRFEYVWKYGPTALLTIIALTWDRVTFQIQMLAPWHRMAKSITNASDGILLDYLNMFPPTAIFSSLKRRNWAPAAALSASLVLQVIVTISTSLIDLRVTEIESLVPVELKTRFNSTVSSLAPDLLLAFFTMAGISDYRFPYPEGTTAQYAYQTPADPLLLGTGIRLNVDGLVTALDCSNNAEIKLLEASVGLYVSLDYIDVAFEVRSVDCHMIVNTRLEPEAEKYTSLNFVRMLVGLCNEPAISDRERTSIIVGKLIYTVDYPKEAIDSSAVAGDLIARISNIKLANSEQAICIPRYGIRKVNFVHRTTSTEEVSLVQDVNSRTLDMLTAWDFMLAQTSIIYENAIPNVHIDIENISVIDLDAFTAISRASELSQVPSSELTDFELWLKAIPSFFQKFSAQIAERSLLEHSPEVVMGNLSQTKNRLIVSGPICHTMAGLLVLCILHCVIIMFTLPKNSPMTTNPTSIIGTAWMALGATSLLLRLRDQGLGEQEDIQERLDTATYKLGQTNRNILRLVLDHRSSKIRPHFSRRPKRPRRSGKHAIILHPISRALFSLSLAGGIILLEALLRLSQNNDGIGPAGIHQYIRYCWTAVPSIFFTAVALTASSIDGATRSLQPFLAMKKGETFPKTLDLDLLDGSLLRTLLKGLRTRSWPSVFAIAAFSTSSVFTIFSGSLYIDQYTPINLHTVLKANTTFGNIAELSFLPGGFVELAYGNVAPSLILGRNSSFPPFIYKDLVFPSLVLDESPWMGIKEYNASNSSALNIAAKVPAIRSKLHCNIYSGEQVQTNLTMNYTATSLGPDMYRAPSLLRIDIDGEGCYVDASGEVRLSAILTIPITLQEGETTFGASSGGNTWDTGGYDSSVSGCGVLTYAWGHVVMDPNGGHTVNAFVLDCNETFEIVDTDVHFKGVSLIIDSSQPPVPNEATSRPADLPPRPPQDSCYWNLARVENTDSSQAFDPFFSHLVLSQRTVLTTDLGNTTAVKKVAAAIRAQHELIRSITIDYYYRISTENLSLYEALPGAHISPRTLLYAANATIHPGRLRVVQEIWPTRVLQALLAVTLASSLLAWWLMPRTDVIVGSPTNIARKLALVAGGNLFEEFLVSGLTYEEIERQLTNSGRIFTLGWRTPAGPTGKERFGIWALSPDEMEEFRQREAKKTSWMLWRR